MSDKPTVSDAGLEADQDLKFRKMADSFIVWRTGIVKARLQL